jgi:hypothetical protein
MGGVARRRQRRRGVRAAIRRASNPARYWGYAALAALVGAWTFPASPDPVILTPLSVLVAAYFLFQVPVWCGAVNRGETTLCRENASGLLMGCHRRQHKWQKLKMAIVPMAWRRLNQGLWANPTKCVATAAALSTVVSAVVASLGLLIGVGR